MIHIPTNSYIQISSINRFSKFRNNDANNDINYWIFFETLNIGTGMSYFFQFDYLHTVRNRLETILVHNKR